MHERLDDLTRRIEQLARSGPEAYAPKRSRNEPDQLAELISRLDRRLDQFAMCAAPAPAPMMPPAMPSCSCRRASTAPSPKSPRASARSTALPRPPRQQPQAAWLFPRPRLRRAGPARALPAQDLSGLEDQLRKITNQIETLRRPGVEEAINALRDELGEIGRTLNDAMPRRALDAIEKQIQDSTSASRKAARPASMRRARRHRARPCRSARRLARADAGGKPRRFQRRDHGSRTRSISSSRRKTRRR